MNCCKLFATVSPVFADTAYGFHDAAESSHASEFRHPVEDIEPAEVLGWDEMQKALAVIFGWITEPHVRPGIAPDSQRGGTYTVHEYICPKKLGMRSAAMIYAMRPDLFPGETFESLALKTGVTKQGFAKHVSSFRTTFGLQTRVMRSPVARENMRTAATQSHVRRKQIGAYLPMFNTALGASL